LANASNCNNSLERFIVHPHVLRKLFRMRAQCLNVGDMSKRSAGRDTSSHPKAKAL
jgi:hypothetical protein